VAVARGEHEASDEMQRERECFLGQISPRTSLDYVLAGPIFVLTARPARRAFSPALLGRSRPSSHCEVYGRDDSDRPPPDWRRAVRASERADERGESGPTRQETRRRGDGSQKGNSFRRRKGFVRSRGVAGARGMRARRRAKKKTTRKGPPARPG